MYVSMINEVKDYRDKHTLSNDEQVVRTMPEVGGAGDLDDRGAGRGRGAP